MFRQSCGVFRRKRALADYKKERSSWRHAGHDMQ